MHELARAIDLEISFQNWRSICRKHAANWKDYPGETRASREAFRGSYMGRWR